MPAADRQHDRRGRSAGFVHSRLRQAASLAAEVAQLIRVLITAAAVAGFGETTLRSGPAGGCKKYAYGAFTEGYSAFWLGVRSLDSMQDAGMLPAFAGIVVSDRYQNYFHPRWKHIAGNQACLLAFCATTMTARRPAQAPSGPCRRTGHCAA